MAVSRWMIGAALCAAIAIACAKLIPPRDSRQSAGSPATQPAFTYVEETRSDPPMRLHEIVIDLTNPSVHVRVRPGGGEGKAARPWQMTLMTTSEIAARDHLALAVDANMFSPKDVQVILGRHDPYFEGNWARVGGWLVCDGNQITPTTEDAPWSAALTVNKAGKFSVGLFDQLPSDTQEAVSGLWLVRDGQNIAPTDKVAGITSERAPRTSAGLDREHKHLILLVVDGRRPDYSAGMTWHQLADEMIQLGAWQAINLDGGGSATMVIRQPNGKLRVVNRPSDGHDLLIPFSFERPVACVLGISLGKD